MDRETKVLWLKRNSAIVVEQIHCIVGQDFVKITCVQYIKYSTMIVEGNMKLEVYISTMLIFALKMFEK